MAELPIEGIAAFRSAFVSISLDVPSQLGTNIESSTTVIILFKMGRLSSIL